MPEPCIRQQQSDQQEGGSLHRPDHAAGEDHHQGDRREPEQSAGERILRGARERSRSASGPHRRLCDREGTAAAVEPEEDQPAHLRDSADRRERDQTERPVRADHVRADLQRSTAAVPGGDQTERPTTGTLQRQPLLLLALRHENAADQGETAGHRLDRIVLQAQADHPDRPFDSLWSVREHSKTVRIATSNSQRKQFTLLSR